MLFCRTCRYNGMSICCFRTCRYNGMYIYCFVERVDTMVCPYAVVERLNTMVCLYVVLKNARIQWYVRMLVCRSCRYNGMSTCCFRTCRYNGMSICCFVERVPGPGAYNPNFSANKTHSPAFTIRSLRREKSHVLGPFSTI